MFGGYRDIGGMNAYEMDRNPDSRVVSERQTSCYGSMLLPNKLDMDQRPLSKVLEVIV